MGGTGLTAKQGFTAVILTVVLLLPFPISSDMVGHGGIIRSIDVSRDGEIAVTGSFDHSLRVWQIDEQRELRVLDGHDGPVNKVAIHPDGKHIASAGADGSVLLWNENSDQPTHSLTAHQGRAMDVVVSNTGRSVLSGGWDRRAILWDFQKGAEIRRYEVTQPIISVAFGDDRETIIVADRSGKLHALKRASGTTIATVSAHDFGLTQMRATPDGRRLITIGLDNAARIWDSRSLEMITEFTPDPETKPVASALSNDGKTMLVAYIDGQVLHLDASTGKLLRSIKAENGPVWSVAFSANGRFALAAGVSENVKVWHLATGDRISIGQGKTEDSVERAQPWLEDDHPGARLFRKCAQCHALTAAEPQRAGPHFQSLFGRPSGSVEQYRYSEALQKLSVNWNRETIAALFSEGPDKFVPGTKMPVQKINDDKALDDLIDYLQILLQ